MKILYSEEFKKCYNRLSKDIQKQVDKQLAFFLGNPRYPSLQVKKMEGSKDIWEGRITKSYRFTFCIQDDTYILRKVGPHDILKTP